MKPAVLQGAVVYRAYQGGMNMADYMDVMGMTGGVTAEAARRVKGTEKSRSSQAGQTRHGQPQSAGKSESSSPAASYMKNGVEQTPEDVKDAQSAIALEEEEQAAEKEAAVSAEETDQEKFQKFLEEFQERQNAFFQRLLKQMQEQIRNAKKKKGTKKLNYNYHRVSGTIMRAKTTTQAGLALSSASAALAAVKRQAASGQYKSSDVEVALQHAQRMVRTARKKVNNMRMESTHKKQDNHAVNSAKQKPKMKKISIEAKRQKKIFDLERELLRKQRKEQNSNRRNEMMELTLADMTYLKRRIEQLKQDEYNQFSADQDSFTASMEGMAAAAGQETESAAAVAEQGMEAQAEAAGGEAAAVPAGGGEA